MPSGSVVFVNVFEVESERQGELVVILESALDQVISHRPGFESATLLASTTGTRVINIAHWRSIADATATQSEPDAARFVQRAAAIAQGAPGLYEIVHQWP